jgi:hypothetical protein
MQSGYDIWIAPSLRNYPVRFTGPDSRNNILELSLISVDFDGRRVFGKDSMPDEPSSHSPDTIPEELLKAKDELFTKPTPALPTEPPPETTTEIPPAT